MGFIWVRFAWPKISDWRQDRDLKAAADYERSGDYRRSLLVLEQVVQLYPDNIEAKRRLAGFYERTGQRQAIELWKEILRLKPNELENQLGYAGVSLRFGDLVEVRRTLRKLEASGQTGAGYYRLAAGLAMLSNDSVAMEHNLAELARLQPDDLRVRLQLAAVRLRIPGHPEAQAAREALIGLAGADVVRIRAIVELFDDIARRWPRPAVERTAEFQHLTRLLAPAMGPRLDPPEISDPVERLFGFAMRQPAPVAEDVVALLHIMALNGRTAAVTEWIETLSEQIRRAPTVLAARADIAARAADWSQLRQLLVEGAWGQGPAAPINLAFEARDAHAGIEPDAARTAWARVLAAEQRSLPGYRVLLRLCDTWGWPEERRAVLVAVTREFPLENWAWQQLVSYALSRGEAGELSQLYQRWVLAQPGDPALRVRAGIMDLLLQQHTAPSSRITAEWMQRQPGEAAPVVAQALALWREQHVPEALAALAALPPGTFTESRYALAYGVLLAEAGRAEESELMLARATADRLLPDELLLAEQARARNRPRLTPPRDR